MRLAADEPVEPAVPRCQAAHRQIQPAKSDVARKVLIAAWQSSPRNPSSPSRAGRRANPVLASSIKWSCADGVRAWPTPLDATPALAAVAESP
jgi:hypothetical protein